MLAGSSQFLHTLLDLIDMPFEFIPVASTLLWTRPALRLRRSLRLRDPQPLFQTRYLTLVTSLLSNSNRLLDLGKRRALCGSSALRFTCPLSISSTLSHPRLLSLSFALALALAFSNCFRRSLAFAFGVFPTFVLVLFLFVLVICVGDRVTRHAEARGQ